ncbi:hypothetical protein AA313_de0205137 [Arthrobotrys entomopaga]|nr:hypothetical protein AA313_de0205137 [Arthrobotrys entomopaga]
MELRAEETLSRAFDKLTHTYDYSDIRAGLLAIDTYLAMVCAGSDPNPNVKPSSFISEGLPYPTGSKLAGFRALQDGFQYNIALRLTTCLSQLLMFEFSHLQVALIVSCLDCLQGALLLHPQSRNIFAREAYMTIFVRILSRNNTVTIQLGALDTLVTALLDCPANMRTFEALNGIKTIALLFKNVKTQDSVRERLTEFIYFYLLPEKEDTQTGYSSVRISESPLEGPNVLSRCRTVKQKHILLGRYLKGIEGIVLDVRHNQKMFEPDHDSNSRN